MTPLDSPRIRKHLANFDLNASFIEELGWDHHAATLEAPIKDQTFTLTAIAQKRGMVAFTCAPLTDGGVPDYATRRKIETQVAKSAHEHIIIYTDNDNTTQIWQWVKREMGKPTACREHHYNHTQPGDALIQKLQSIAFSLEEEEDLTIVHVASRCRAAFDVDRVTKRFYDRFKNEHVKFLDFIKGIPDAEVQRWYASVMLNRLMFIYFIQKKGFLDSDIHYLSNKLTESMLRGTDRFHSDLLCPLFFEGFAKHESERSADVNQLLGKVPYLNGGIFQRHQIEELHGEAIRIADAAFEKLFDFFEQYQWHLDERPLRNDNEINPDVLGYIFEKYINQKQMGAYYTKEDITEYISKNTVIPRIFDIAQKKCKIAFEGEQSVWRLLQTDPDRYIYPAIKKGVELELPPEIAAGLNDVSKRTDWNKPAPEEYALPTEFWREVVARRQRYEEVKSKIENGEIEDINDLITYNLDIRQFAQAVIENCEGPELLRALWKAIQSITVLDPTCGSGAFLFAALNILEALYQACLDRMRAFVGDLDRSGAPRRPEKFSDFRKVLKSVDEHPNDRYFILKSIIVNNLFGVDIMEEAVEICKLRLFLKLVAQVVRVENIEPLPDIDFNIRAGNTLVGFANYDEVKRAVTSKLDFDNAMGRIEEKAQGIDQLFTLFRQQQTELGGDVTPDDKRELRNRLGAFEDELNRYLAGEYGIDPDDNAAFEKWRKSHSPFHWFIEFYGIIQTGGFDVIIGNPPYVADSKVKTVYTLPPNTYKAEACGNLYGFVMERSYTLQSRNGRLGMIVPVSCVSGESYKSLARITFCVKAWVSTYSNRPGKLFRGVEQRLAILVRCPGEAESYSTSYQHWYEKERPSLFSLLSYHPAPRHSRRGTPYKVGASLAATVLDKICRARASLAALQTGDGRGCWFHDGPTYWIRALPFEPNAEAKSSRPNHYHHIRTRDPDDAFVLAGVLSSSTFYFFFKSMSNCRDFGRKEFDEFPMGDLDATARTRLQELGRALANDLKRTARRCTRVYPSGEVEYEEYYPSDAKPILDEIDRVLAQHYGFTDEELDFIINYDIKYRMGRDDGG